jgi:hypothetical protein
VSMRSGCGALLATALTIALGGALANASTGAMIAARGPSATLRVSQAAGSLAKIPTSRFAHGRHTRSMLLRRAAVAARLAKGKRTCAALAATNALLSALGTPTTWKHSRIPRSSLRQTLRLLSAAGRTQLRSAGRRCAKPANGHALKAHKGGAGGAKVPPPSEPPEQGEGINPPLPAGKFRPPKTTGGQSGFGPNPFGAPPEALAARSPIGSYASPFSRWLTDPIATAASDPLTFFRNSDVGVPPRQASPQEVTTAIGENIVWYTGNTSVALSTDAGRTFTMFDPSNVLPDEGLAFCCDQLVSYSPSYKLFVWVMQYWCDKSCLTTNSEGKAICRSDGVHNRIRIAVASPADLRANASNPGAAWTYWDVTPSTIGQPGNAWFDRSDLSVNPWNMNWSVDVLCGSGASLLGRISLEQLSHHGTVSLGYIVDSPQRMQTAQGLGTTTTYFTGSNSGSQARIWSWEPFSGTLFRHDIDHSSVPNFDNEIKGTDGGNWYDRYGIFPGAVESSTLSGGTLYLAQGTGRAYCTAKCSTSTPTLKHVFDQPAILVTKYDVSTWKEIGERWLWNPTYAVGWPALQTDGVGEVGVSFRASPSNSNPQPVAGFLTPDEQFVLALPAGMPHETGDYYSLRPGRTAESFVMPAQTVQNDPGGPAMHWNFIEYGHGPAPYVSPPSVSITAPANLATFLLGNNITYTAQVSDPVDGTLPDQAIVWTEDGAEIGRGPQIVRHGSPTGTHTIVVTATNGDGKSAGASITVRVLAPSPPGAPQVSIVKPKDGSAFVSNTRNNENLYCENIQFEATATGGAGKLTYSWTDSVNSAAPQQVSTQLSPLLSLCAGSEEGSSSTHDLTLSVSDGVNPPTTAVLRVYVDAFKIP